VSSTSNRRPKAILWDLGGVLIEVDLDASRGLWNRHTGLDGTYFDDAFFESKLWAQMVIGEVDASGIMSSIDGFLERVGGQPVSSAVLTDIWNACLRPRSQVVELIRLGAEQAETGVLSDTDLIHADYIQRTAGFFDVVKAWTFSFEVGKRKPHPSIYIEALARLGADPKQTLFIDDRIENVNGARAIGMDSVLYRDTEELRTQLQRRGLL
jgi:HAD superfamily hydrolase (TIGR01509 family)